MRRRARLYNAACGGRSTGATAPFAARLIRFSFIDVAGDIGRSG
jgi:hypothetical protein